MTYGTVQANAIQGSINTFSPNSAVFRNRIINGAMVIDQRNAGSSVTPVNNTYNLDRWKAYLTQSSKFTVQQDAGAVTPPTGFSDYLGATSSSAYSVLTGDYFLIAQALEGLNVADLDWGTANAKTVTLSFWVRSSLTGTFGGAFGNNAGNRAYPFSYTISSANTWEYKTITVVGDTTGTWLKTNGTGIIIYWGLGAGATVSGTAGAWAASGAVSATGATSVVGTNGATFYITGVQLEVGSTATSFDYRPYGTELMLCQRYFYQTNRYVGLTQASDTLYGPAIAFPVTMRTTPTLNAGATFTARTGSNGTPLISSGVTGIVATNDAVAVYNSSSNWSTNTWVSFNGGFTAEL